MADPISTITCLLVFLQFFWSVLNTAWVLAWVQRQFITRPRLELNSAQERPPAPDLATIVDQVRGITAGMGDVEARLHETLVLVAGLLNLLRDISEDQRRLVEETLQRLAAALMAAGEVLRLPSQAS
jgi:hypothetical protein